MCHSGKLRFGHKEVRSPSSSLEKGQVVCLGGTSDTAGDEERARSGNAVKIKTSQSYNVILRVLQVCT